MRTSDQRRGHLSGDFGGDDVLEKRVLTIPVGINSTTASGAWTLLNALKTAWGPSLLDIPLALSFAETTITYQGRPRGMDIVPSTLSQGWIDVLLTFEALNPFAAGETVDVVVGPTPTIIANLGNAPVNDRWSMVLTTSGSTVTITNGASGEPPLVIDTSGVAELTLDGYQRTLFADSVQSPFLVTPGSGWMQLVPGNQSVTVTGATGTLTYTTLYL
jgi:phage-related protein